MVVTDSTRTVAEESLRLLSENELFRTLDGGSLSALAEVMEPVVLGAGEVLIRQGDVGDSMYIVTEGMLRALVAGADGLQVEVGRIAPGSPVGEMQVVIGGDRSATVEALEPSRLLRLPRSALEVIAERTPGALASLRAIVHQRLVRNQLATRLPEILGPLDVDALADLEEEVERVSLKRGEALFRQGDACDGWYVVASGRLQIVRRERNGTEVVLSEAGGGESVGEITAFTGEPRTATPYALRDTQLFRFSTATFEKVMLRHPRALLSITQVLIKRLVAPFNPEADRQLNVAIIPSGPGAPVADFARRLEAELAKIGSTLRIDARRLSELRVLDNASDLSDTHPNWLRFSIWLDEQSASHRFIVLESDPGQTGWTRTVLSQADVVLIVADATADKTPGEIEAALLDFGGDDSHRARRTLILVHPALTKLPSGTREWLSRREVDGHHHVRAGSDADVGRVARTLAGCAVGLALGGGGARGFAHIGVVKALKELGIPIDFIGGTSMGSVMAGQIALGLSTEEILEKNREVIATKPFSEYTIPMIAMLKTERFNQTFKMSFGDTQIEDLWLNYFAVSCNLTTAEMVIHDSGYVWEATRASASLPGIAVPFVKGIHMLVDGGVVNNLPGDIMRERCTGSVIAVNVSPEEDLALGASGLPSSQWKIFWSRVLPFRKKLQAPRLMDILMRATFLARFSRAHEVERSVDLSLSPPIDEFGMLDFEKIDALADLGYEYTMKAAADWTGPRLV